MTWYNIKERTADNAPSALQRSSNGLCGNHQITEKVHVDNLQICKYVIASKDMFLVSWLTALSRVLNTNGISKFPVSEFP